MITFLVAPVDARRDFPEHFLPFLFRETYCCRPQSNELVYNMELFVNQCHYNGFIAKAWIVNDSLL